MPEERSSAEATDHGTQHTAAECDGGGEMAATLGNQNTRRRWPRPSGAEVERQRKFNGDTLTANWAPGWEP